jgi:hypothetical protein
MPRIKTNERRYLTIKNIIGSTIIISTIGFCLYMGISALIDGSKGLSDLSYSKGLINDVYFTKQKRKQGFRIISEAVLVIGVDGTNQKFGFRESSDAYKTLTNLKKFGRPAVVYYYKQNKRNEGGVTLNVWDLTVGNYKVIEIATVKKGERLFSLYFFSIGIVCLVIVISGIRSTLKQRKKIVANKDRYSLIQSFFSKLEK